VTDKITITNEINVLVGGNFEAWRIGLTNDPIVRKRQLKEAQGEDVSRWQQWQADSLGDARLIEAKFRESGMGASSQGGDMVTDDFPTFVYIC